MKKSLISAIKKLLTKLGAEEIEGNNLVEVIDSGADAIEGGGGSGGVYIVHRVLEDGGIVRLDKTWDEIKTALATSIVLLVIPSGIDGISIEIVYSAFRQDIEVDGVYTIFYKVLTENLPTKSETWIANNENSYPVLDDSGKIDRSMP